MKKPAFLSNRKHGQSITSNTTEMLIHDLLVEAARLKGVFEAENSNNKLRFSKENNEHRVRQIYDIKQRWNLHGRNAKPRGKRMFTVV
ncbi:hypothetical protein V6N11_011666 [Hibiscus sabdariffa]|uniref:Uncharacterized protein n=1 Tax=Hibiscus sabdariffa TaxID=183260 RepID=A0ABR2S8Y0_9ROSI